MPRPEICLNLMKGSTNVKLGSLQVGTTEYMGAVRNQHSKQEVKGDG